jgi:hypothetical protein
MTIAWWRDRSDEAIFDFVKSNGPTSAPLWDSATGP